MLLGGAKWAVDRGYGTLEDLNRIEERGCVQGAAPKHVSSEAKRRQRDQMGTLGSGNHYLEVQKIAEIFDDDMPRFLACTRTRLSLRFTADPAGWATRSAPTTCAR